MTTITIGIRPLLGTRPGTWLYAHRISLAVLLPVLAVTSLVRFWNFAGGPGTWNDDEGTYVSQAWAMLFKGQLAHYTYWYDHPPFGWLQIALWAGLTHGFDRYDVAVLLGRELVGIYAVVTAVILYALCRRLGVHRTFSALAVIIFMVSPLGLSYGVQVYLDTLFLPWAFGALLAATYVDKSHSWGILSGLLLAGALLTKETSFFFVPVVIWIIWRTSDRALRWKNVLLSLSLTVLVGLFYVLLAALKGELVPGAGHTSLGYGIYWQLFGRAGGGSIFDPSSLTFTTVTRWFAQDPVTLVAGVVLLGALALRRSLWPIGLLGLIHYASLLRTGFTPVPYAVVLVPIGALVVAGACDAIWQRTFVSKPLMVTNKVLGVALAMAFLGGAAILWPPKIERVMNDVGLSYERQTVAWIERHSPPSRGDVILTDDNLWPDLIMRGYSRDNVDWIYKVDFDPAVLKRYVPVGGQVKDAWKHVDYIAVPPLGGTKLITTLPTLQRALDHATEVQRFTGNTDGEYVIYKVDHDRSSQ